MFALPNLSPARRVASAGLTWFAFFSFALGSVPHAQANVYATNIRIKGSIPSTATAATVFVPCDTVQISYVLNEPADAGVAIEILSGTNVVWISAIAAGNPGALRGSYLLIWGVTNNAGNPVPLGSYTVRITAAANGHGDWTQISDDFNAGNYVYAPRGIAVNRNTNSLYYGRVFVSNGEVGPNAGFDPGDRLGIGTLNADGSRAAEGGFSDGGWFLPATNSRPSKIEVSDDDYLYVNDGARGVVLRFDQTISSESRTLFLRPDNRPNGSTTNLSGPFITRAGTNTQVWMADTNYPGGVGIRNWTTAGGGMVATNDLGVTVVEAGTNSDLNLAPFDVAVDWSNRIYTIQFRDASGDPADRVMRFPTYDSSAAPQTNADWKIGSGDDSLRGVSGIAVDPTATYVAVAVGGSGVGLGRTGGAARILSAADGSDVQTLTPAPYHDHTDVTWDNVGNLYVCDNWDSLWRVFSPPGANSATNVAVQILEVAQPPLAPVLNALSYTNGLFRFTLGGRTNIDYIIEGSTNLNLHAWVPVATNRDTCATRLVVVSSSPSQRFFRAHPAVTP